MQKGNVKILAASAVVIVAILLASWAWYGDDGSTQEARTEVSVGDTMTYDIYMDGTYVSTVRQTILEVEDGEALSSYVYDGVFLSALDRAPVDQAGVTMPEGDPYEAVGTETIETAFGTKDCEVRINEYGGLEYRNWCADNDVIYRYEYTEVDGTVVTSELTATTLFGEAPSEQAGAFAGVSQMPVPGTWYTIGMVDDETMHVISYNILRTDGGSVVVDTYEDGVLTAPRVLSLKEFNAMWTQSGTDPVGEETIMTSWGLVDTVVTSTTAAYGGLEQTVTYWNDASGALMKLRSVTTEDGAVVDDYSAYVIKNDALFLEEDLVSPVLRQEFIIGDTVTIVKYSHGDPVYRYVDVWDVWDGGILIAFNDSDNSEDSFWMDVGMYVPLIPEEALGEPVGTDIVPTPYGVIECEIRPYPADGAMIYVHDGIVFAYTYADEGIYYLYDTSLTSDAPVFDEKIVVGVGLTPDIGDMVSYGVVAADGSWQIDWTVESVNGDSVVVSIADDAGEVGSETFTLGEFAELFSGRGSQSLGTETILTGFGTVEADVTCDVEEVGDTTVTTVYWTDALGVVYKKVVTVVDADGNVTETRYYLTNNDLLMTVED